MSPDTKSTRRVAVAALLVASLACGGVGTMLLMPSKVLHFGHTGGAPEAGDLMTLEELEDHNIALKASHERELDAATDGQELLKRVNVIRCMHGAVALKWNSKLATKAQSWADTGNKAHSTSLGAFTKYGENMCFGFSMKECVAFWYEEIKKSPGGKGEGGPWDYQESHYTQLVWRATTQMGCGIGEGNLAFCQFLPRGNWAGQCPDCYEDQVFGKEKEESECNPVD